MIGVLIMEAARPEAKASQEQLLQHGTNLHRDKYSLPSGSS